MGKTKKTRCDECPSPRKQCEDCRGWDEFRTKLADKLAGKFADAILEARNR